MSISPRPLAILGPTASGKTALAVALAHADPTIELVSVDAFSCYRGLDVGTAKPTAAERAAAPWHLLDLVEPSEELTVAEFATAGRAVLDDLARRGRRAVLVGGSGLYLRALVDDLRPPPRYPEVAAALEARADRPGGLAELYAELTEADPLGAARMTPTNRRRVVRALEVTLGSGVPFSSHGPGLETYPERPFVLVGLKPSPGDLSRRLAERLEAQLAAGFLDEVARILAAPGGLSRTAAQAIGYGELAEVLAGRLDLDAAREQVLVRSRRLARRQLAWLRRDPRVHWLPAGAPDLALRVAELLAAEVPSTPCAEAAAGREDDTGAQTAV